MGLEMKTHRDVAAFEAKPMFGLTWRRLGALAIMIFGGGAVFFTVASVVLAASGTSWEVAVPEALQAADGTSATVTALTRATTAGMYAMFPVLVPVALWAWLRPMGMKPEHYAQYYFRHHLTSKVTHYEDTYAHLTVPVDEPVSRAAGIVRATQQPAGRSGGRRPRSSQLRRSLSEHAESPPKRTRNGR